MPKTKATCSKSAVSGPQFVLRAAKETFSVEPDSWMATTLRNLMYASEDHEETAFAAAALKVAKLGGLDTCEPIEIPLALRLSLGSLRSLYDVGRATTWRLFGGASTILCAVTKAAASP